jgi:high-affinity Fe2+/Pb2+ permease
MGRGAKGAGAVAGLVGYSAALSFGLYFGTIHKWTGHNAWWIRLVIDTFCVAAVATLVLVGIVHFSRASWSDHEADEELRSYEHTHPESNTDRFG